MTHERTRVRQRPGHPPPHLPSGSAQRVMAAGGLQTTSAGEVQNHIPGQKPGCAG